jgi:FlaG/FlaF family flagellin (archaellin)
MRNSVLPIAIAFVLAAPCTALAGGKKDTIEVLSPSFGAGTQPTTSTTGGTTKRDISSGQATGKRQWKPVTTLKENTGSSPTAGKPLTTTIDPALQSNVLGKGTVGGSSGPTKHTRQ